MSEQKKALLVRQRPDLFQPLAEQLCQKGYEVCTVDSLRAAVDKIADGYRDLVISGLTFDSSNALSENPRLAVHGGFFVLHHALVTAEVCAERCQAFLSTSWHAANPGNLLEWQAALSEEVRYFGAKWVEERMPGGGRLKFSSPGQLALLNGWDRNGADKVFRATLIDAEHVAAVRDRFEIR